MYPCSESVSGRLPHHSAGRVAARRAALKTEIAASRAELGKLAEGASEDMARSLTEETALLERIDAVYAEQQRTLQHAADLAKEAADASALACRAVPAGSQSHWLQNSPDRLSLPLACHPRLATCVMPA